MVITPLGVTAVAARHSGMKSDKVRVSGVDIDPIDLETLLTKICDYASVGTPALINNVNVHAMNLAHEDPAFREILNQSEVVFCDGFGVKLGARIVGHRLGERMTPPDWIDRLFEQCAVEGHTVYFVGDEERVVTAFAEAVAAHHPQLSIVGYRNGFFAGDEAAELLDELRTKRPSIVITGMGMPRQEKWARSIRDELQHGVYVATGALFRWYIGHERRAPRWMTDHGLEWLARLITAPRRLWRRYVLGIPRFLLRVMRERALGPGP